MSASSRREFLRHVALATVTLPLLNRPLVALDLVSPSAAGSADARPRFSRLGAFKAEGDLAERLSRSFDRLEQGKYLPANVYQRDKEAGNWPADTEGRTLLGLILLSQSGGRPARYLEEILAKWPQEINERGFFGQISPPGQISEQQLSGHSWMLRALSELERMQPGGKARRMAMPILENLYLPTKGKHRAYPIDAASRAGGGEASGTHQGLVGDWLLSTDVGCDFISLDGLVDAFEVFGDDRLRPLIDEMVGRFLQIDLVAVRAQTHATLTACRALLRWSELSGQPDLVAAVAERYALYTREAWTEHYSNFNWFGRPQWTEACAVVDSLMVAMELWRLTGSTRYLEDAHHIYYNAFGHAQRANGGFGCDNCPGGDGEDDLFFRVYEAHWCCTMRGAEGLSRVTQYAVANTADEWLLPLWLPGRFKNQDAELVVESRYPFEPTLTVTRRGGSGPKTVSLFVPPWMRDVHAINAAGARRTPDGVWLRMNIGSGESWRVTGELLQGTRPTMRPGGAKPRVVRYRGPLVLAGAAGEPIFDAYKSGAAEKDTPRYRLLVE